MQTALRDFEPGTNKLSKEYASSRFIGWKIQNKIASMTQPDFDSYLAQPPPWAKTDRLTTNRIHEALHALKELYIRMDHAGYNS